MNNISVTLLIDHNMLNRMLGFYHDQTIAVSENYVIFMAKNNGVTIKAYSNKHKPTFKVVFAGNNALKEARIWDTNATINEVKNTEVITWSHMTHIGSDEVGVGDLFAPIVVVAAYVEENMIEELRSLGVDDSKKLSDAKIRLLAPILMKKVLYHSLTMSNEKLNEMMEKNAKSLALEALMHNKCHLVLLKKIHDDCPVYVDQFLKEDIYLAYLGNTSRPKSLNFATKGESKYPAIAVASIIARFIFLTYMDDLNKKYDTIFPLGASLKVDQFLIDFIEKHGIYLTSTLVKKHFNNFSSILKGNIKLDI